ncbi:hypothetical protein [Phenylobacterium sp.]|uniref:hypothetical protein n=1 Tax=Phenylobacterium sp. TaxID=1871053 RepID=UPI0030F4645F
MRAILLAIALCLAPGSALAQPEASPVAGTSPVEPALAEVPAAPPQMKNTGRLGLESLVMETYIPKPLTVIFAIALLVGGAALHDLTAGRAARRVPLGPMLRQSWGFWGRYWRRAPGPAVLLVLVAGVTVMSFRTEMGFLNLLGLAGLFLLMVVAMGAAWRLGGQTLEPGRTDLALGPLGIQFGAVEIRVLGAMLLLVVVELAFELVSFVGSRAINMTDSVTAMAAFFALLACAMLYVFGRLMLLAPRAGLGRGIAPLVSWRLTRAALLPLAVVVLVPHVMTLPLSEGLNAILPMGKWAPSPAEAVLALIFLAVTPFGWGAQIAMLRALEPAPEA